MSKRVRGPVRTHRRPAGRPSSTPARRQATVPSQLVAAEVIASDVIEGKPSEAATELEQIARSTPARGRVRPGSLLAVRAASEYVYVAQDMRRILLVAGALFGTLFVLWLLLVILRVIALPFY